MLGFLQERCPQFAVCWCFFHHQRWRQSCQGGARAVAELTRAHRRLQVPLMETISACSVAEPFACTGEELTVRHPGPPDRVTGSGWPAESSQTCHGWVEFPHERGVLVALKASPYRRHSCCSVRDSCAET